MLNNLNEDNYSIPGSANVIEQPVEFRASEPSAPNRQPATYVLEAQADLRRSLGLYINSKLRARCCHQKWSRKDSLKSQKVTSWLSCATDVGKDLRESETVAWNLITLRFFLELHWFGHLCGFDNNTGVSQIWHPTCSVTRLAWLIL